MSINIRNKISDVVAILAFVLMIPLNIMTYISWLIFGAIVYTSDRIIWKQKTKFISYRKFMLTLV